MLFCAGPDHFRMRLHLCQRSDAFGRASRAFSTSGSSSDLHFPRFIQAECRDVHLLLQPVAEPIVVSCPVGLIELHALFIRKS